MSNRQKLTDDEKRARRHAAKAERVNAKATADIPLFADQVERVTADDMQRHWRLVRASVGEGMSTLILGDGLLEAFQEWTIRYLVRSIVGEDVFQKLDDYRWRTYPKSGYGWGFWRGVLCGKRVEFAFEAVKDRKPGHPAVVCTEWYEQATMTTEAFRDLFPILGQLPGAEPHHDDRLEKQLDAAISLAFPA